MTKQQANKLLDEVKLGKPHLARDIDLALLTTGDLHGKLYSLDTYLNNRFLNRDNPTSHHRYVEDLDGEQT